MSTNCSADGGSVDVVTADSAVTYSGLADGTHQFTAESLGVAYVIDVQVSCESADPGVTASVTGVGAPPVPFDTVVTDTISTDTISTDTVTTDTLVMMPMLFRGAPMPSSLPSTGGNDTGVAGLALLLVVAGAAILRLVRRPA